jgi:hypothetical protein
MSTAQDGAVFVPDRRRTVVDRVLTAISRDQRRVVRQARDAAILQGSQAGFVAGWRLSSLTITNTCSSGSPSASACGQPVSVSATGLRMRHALLVGGDDRAPMLAR